MATRQTATIARWMRMPSIAVLLIWMIVPLAMTLWFSFQYYNLLDPTTSGFAGFDNYTYLLTDPSLWTAMANTLYLVFWVLLITVGLGTLLAVLFDQDFYGRGVARLFAIAPFFVMPTVSALIWKNMLMHPVNGLFAFFARSLGLPPIDFFGNLPLTSVIIIVAWQWLPFALLILLTAIQSLDSEQKEAARMDGAGPFSMFFFIILPHLGRAISVVIMRRSSCSRSLPRSTSRPPADPASPRRTSPSSSICAPCANTTSAALPPAA